MSESFSIEQPWPFTSLNEARGMAVLLSQFDWHRPVEDLGDDEIRAVARVAAAYREELQFAQQVRHLPHVNV